MQCLSPIIDNIHEDGIDDVDGADDVDGDNDKSYYGSSCVVDFFLFFFFFFLVTSTVDLVDFGHFRKRSDLCHTLMA